MAVVGAGAAGLAVAGALAGAGIEVICLEARDRIGGRLLSVDSDAGFLDLGATWFWTGEERLRRLISATRIAVHRQYTAGDALYEHPGGVRRLHGNPIDAHSYRYTHGARSVSQALAAMLPPGTVRVNAPVSSITVDETGAQVAGSGMQVAADHVVIAVPPALAVREIRLHPALPDRLDRLARQTPVWMGAVTKIVAVYPDAFWRADGLAGAAVSDIGPLREVHDMSGPAGTGLAALFGFASGSQPGPEPIAGRAAEQLARLYGKRAATPSELLVQDWAQERYTSPPQVGTLTDYRLFGHPLYSQAALGGRLHWASTETSQDSPGHVEGALAAAERAAIAVLDALRGPPQHPTTTATGKRR